MVKQKTEKTETSEEKPVWLKYTETDIDAIIVKLAKQGLTSEKIGLELRDIYGIPTVKIYGKRIKQILKDNELYEDSNLLNLEKKQEIIKKHFDKNKQDKRAKLALTTTSARITKYKNYKKRKNANPDSRKSEKVSGAN